MKNQKQTIRKIVGFLNNAEEDGGLWLPNIQRPFVWTADGFLWNGRAHNSLSGIARAITGTKWSGPRFFGMRESLDESCLAIRAPGWSRAG